MERFSILTPGLCCLKYNQRNQSFIVAAFPLPWDTARIETPLAGHALTGIELGIPTRNNNE
jgi:hypothetical protein